MATTHSPTLTHFHLSPSIPRRLETLTPEDWEKLTEVPELVDQVNAILSDPSAMLNETPERSAHQPGDEPEAVAALQTKEAWGMPTREGANKLVYQGFEYVRYQVRTSLSSCSNSPPLSFFLAS